MIIQNIAPRSNNAGNLGTETKKWNTVYANNIPLVDEKLNDYYTAEQMDLRLASVDAMDEVQRETTYAVGDKLASSALPAGTYLECIEAGTTGTETPTELDNE